MKRCNGCEMVGVKAFQRFSVSGGVTGETVETVVKPTHEARAEGACTLCLARRRKSLRSRINGFQAENKFCINLTH